MKYKKLISTIKESVKKASKTGVPDGYPFVPLVNYQPPGMPIIINPILNSNSTVPQGPKPLEQGN